MKELEEHKRRLLEESEIRRASMAPVWASIDRQLDWVDRTVMFVQRAQPVCMTALTIWDWWKSRRKD